MADPSSSSLSPPKVGEAPLTSEPEVEDLTVKPIFSEVEDMVTPIPAPHTTSHPSHARSSSAPLTPPHPHMPRASSVPVTRTGTKGSAQMRPGSSSSSSSATRFVPDALMNRLRSISTAGSNPDRVPEPLIPAPVISRRSTEMLATANGLDHHRRATDPGPHMGLTPSATSLNLFDQAHGGRKKDNGKSHLADLHAPLSFDHLIRKPLVRQWIHQGKYYHETSERITSKMELFFDLVFVGVVHVLSESALHGGASGLNFLKFMLIFYPAYSIWVDVRNYTNISGSDDLQQRLYQLVIMILLVGYAANAAGIEFERGEAAETGAEPAPATGSGSGEATSTASAEGAASTVIPTVVAAVAGGLINAVTSSTPTEGSGAAAGSGPMHLAPSAHAAIQAAVSFFLVAKGVRLLLYLIYAWYLPRFRAFHLFEGVIILINMVWYFPLLAITRPSVIIALPCTAIVTELVGRYIFAKLLSWDRNTQYLHEGDVRIPALNVGYIHERCTAFMVVVLGESVINSTYTAIGTEYGLHHEFGRATLVLIIAFALIWTYYDADSTRTFLHGQRRHWFTKITFTHLHWPLTAALILSSASMSEFVSNEYVEQGVRWYLGGGLGTALLCITAIGSLHKNLDIPGSDIAPRWVRLWVRVGISIMFILLPLGPNLASISQLAIYAGVMIFLVIFETITKLGATGRDLEDLPSNKEVIVNADGTETERDISPDSEGNGSQGGDPEKGESPVKAKKFYDDEFITDAERGEDDLGVEGSLGRVEVRQLTMKQRLAYCA